MINVGSGRKSFYPEKGRERTVMTFLNHKAEYKIHYQIFNAYRASLGSDPELRKRYLPALKEDTGPTKKNPPKRSAREATERNVLQRTEGRLPTEDPQPDEWHL